MKPDMTVAPVRAPEPPVARKVLTRAEFGQLMIDQMGPLRLRLWREAPAHDRRRD